MDKNTFGLRLKGERKRLGLTQEEFSSLGGVKKLAQINYEKDKTLPDVGYLLLVGEAGVDISYVLTGKLSTTDLSNEESNLISGFRSLDTRGKSGVLALISGINPEQKSPKNVFHGTVGQIIDGDVTQNPTFNFGVQTKE